MRNLHLLKDAIFLSVVVTVPKNYTRDEEEGPGNIVLGLVVLAAVSLQFSMIFDRFRLP